MPIDKLGELYKGEFNNQCVDHLRQWLNERPEGMVTTKELEHWLRPLLEALQKAQAPANINLTDVARRELLKKISNK